MVEDIDARYHLDWASSIGAIHPFFDFHIHPFDVFGGDIEYQADPLINGLFDKGSAIYKPPKIDNIVDLAGERFQTTSENSRAIVLASRFIYSHTGPKVFSDQLDLAGIAKAMLLPVARGEYTATHLLEVSQELFKQQDRFYIACPIPVGIPPNKLIDFYNDRKKYNQICAIKIHPNLAGIDPNTQIGKELIETTLIAAGNLKVPVIVHGGFTSGLSTPDSIGYGTLERLVNIDWNITSSPVIIAHAGCYGLAENEMSSTIPILNSLFERSPHVMADVSALNLPALRMLFTRVDRTRLIFGSDALYFTVWKAWVLFLYALRTVSNNPDEELIRIASLNPIHCLGFSLKSTL